MIVALSALGAVPIQILPVVLTSVYDISSLHTELSIIVGQCAPPSVCGGMVLRLEPDATFFVATFMRFWKKIFQQVAQ